MKVWSKSNTVGLWWFQLVAMTTLQMPSSCNPYSGSLIVNQNSMSFCKIMTFHKYRVANHILISFYKFYLWKFFRFFILTLFNEVTFRPHVHYSRNKQPDYTNGKYDTKLEHYIYICTLNNHQIQFSYKVTEPKICLKLGSHLGVFVAHKLLIFILNLSLD